MKQRTICILLTMISCLSLYAQTQGDYKESFELQYKQLSDSEKQKLEKSLVIIKGDYIFVNTENINGIELSNVIISKKLIKDDTERFYISHLIRNILIEGAVIKNYDDNGNDLTMSPYINIDGQYIKKHKKNIIKVLYFLLNKKYFNLYAKLQSSGDKIFETHLLTPIKKDVDELKARLIKENAIEFVTHEMQ